MTTIWYRPAGTAGPPSVRTGRLPRNGRDLWYSVTPSGTVMYNNGMDGWRLSRDYHAAAALQSLRVVDRVGSKINSGLAMDIGL